MAMSLKDKIVFTTGASSGMGKAAAEQFAAAGARIIITARRKERLAKLAQTLQEHYQVDVLPLSLDVQNHKQVDTIIKELPKSWQSIDILLNNAGVALTRDKLQEGDPENWDTMIKTNLCGLLYVTRAILPGMIARDHGHIINVSSIAAYEYYPTGNVYCATKHAVKAISKSLRLDLMGTSLRVTDIAPGATETEFSEVRWQQDKARAKEQYAGFIPLSAEDIADAIIYSASRPLHVDISEMVIFPTAQASVYHIHKSSGSHQDLFKT